MVVVTQSPWFEPPRIRHQVARQMARFTRVLFVETPTDWRQRTTTTLEEVAPNITRCRLGNPYRIPLRLQLYLDPLRERVKGNGGRVYRGGPTIVLLVDVKSEADPTYAVLHDELKTYADMLTTFRGDRMEPRAITVIVSGNRARDAMVAQPVRYAAIDGRSADLETNPSAALVPLVSDNWQKLFTWRWEGQIPDDQRKAMLAWIDRAHAQGRKVRFWNTPDRPDAWTLLLEAGVDVIGTDDLAGLQRFLLARPGR